MPPPTPCCQRTPSRRHSQVFDEGEAGIVNGLAREVFGEEGLLPPELTEVPDESPVQPIHNLHRGPRGQDAEVHITLAAPADGKRASSRRRSKSKNKSKSSGRTPPWWEDYDEVVAAAGGGA
jgi:hypothetical protein